MTALFCCGVSHRSLTTARNILTKCLVLGQARKFYNDTTKQDAVWAHYFCQLCQFCSIMFNKNMKYILIFFLTLSFAAPALAARQVPGTTPVVQPLQPPPQNVFPNVKANITQSQRYVSGSASGSPAQTASSSTQNSGAALNSQSQGQSSSSASGFGFGKIIIIVLLAALVVGLAYVIFSSQK